MEKVRETESEVVQHNISKIRKAKEKLEEKIQNTVGGHGADWDDGKQSRGSG